MKIRNTRLFATAVLLFMLAAPGWSLPLGEREASHFGREVVRIFGEIITNEAELAGGDIQINLSGKSIHEVPIQSAKITFRGFSSAQFSQMRESGANITRLMEGGSVEVEAFITAGAINGLIAREIGRVKTNNRIFDKLSLTLLNNQVRVTGRVDFRKIPGNIFGFLATDSSPFTATVKFLQSGSQINIDILDAKVNDQPMTPELRQQLLAWLNPVWDFSILPYAAALEDFKISPAGLAFNGKLFD